MKRHYKLTDETINVYGRTLHRIECIEDYTATTQIIYYTYLSAFYSFGQRKWVFPDGMYDVHHIDNVTHWMPIPSIND